MKLATDYISNNDVPISAMTVSYPLDELRGFFSGRTLHDSFLRDTIMSTDVVTLEETNLEFPIECIRYNKNGFYSVFRVDDGGYFFVFWTQPLNETQDIPNPRDVSAYFTCYLCDMNTYSDFEKLRIGVDTLENVLDIAPYTEVTFLRASGIYSYSLMDDGRILEVRYASQDNLQGNDRLIITSISIVEKATSSSLVATIRDGDLP